MAQGHCLSFTADSWVYYFLKVNVVILHPFHPITTIFHQQRGRSNDLSVFMLNESRVFLHPPLCGD